MEDDNEKFVGVPDTVRVRVTPVRLAGFVHARSTLPGVEDAVAVNPVIGSGATSVAELHTGSP